MPLTPRTQFLISTALLAGRQTPTSSSSSPVTGSSGSLPVLHVYYHCYLIEGWQDLVAEQMERLHRGGLYAAAGRIVIGLIGTPYEMASFVSRYSDGDKTLFLRESSWDHAEEFKTLQRLHQDAQDAQDASESSYDVAWYFHTKGITHRTSPVADHVRDWRLLMEYYLLDRWQDALWALQSGNRGEGSEQREYGESEFAKPEPHDLYGVNWRGPEQGVPWHFSGNFFVARRRYLAALPAPIFEGRFSNEFWVGQSESKPRVFCAHESGLIHYHGPYPENRYRALGARVAFT